MELTLERRYKKTEYTIGILSVDGKYFCETVEDKDRGLSSDMPVNKIRRAKVPNKTAIPTGRYKIDMNTVSPRFRLRYWATRYNGIVPRLLSVPCWSGVLIHVGATADSSAGCVIVGQNKIKGGVVRSAETFYKLMDEYLIPARQRGEEIWITIV